MAIVCLGGGVGATRLWRELASVVGQDRLTIVVNTADDLWQYGLRVCPDIDTVIYGLAGKQDIERGWGLRDETFRAMGAIRNLGAEPWFALGDQDLGTHMLRTQLLRAGFALGTVTARLARAQGVTSTVLPMCDEEVATEVYSGELGWLSFQEFHVKHRAGVAVDAVRYTGLEAARTPWAVADALSAAELIIIGPSNPVTSVLPILGCGDTRAAIENSSVPVVAVTPVVTGVPMTDAGDQHRGRTRERLMAALGMEHRAAEVARLYSDFVSHFVVDDADVGEVETVRSLGITPLVAPTLTHLPNANGAELVRAVLGARSGRATERESRRANLQLVQSTADKQRPAAT